MKLCVALTLAIFTAAFTLTSPPSSAQDSAGPHVVPSSTLTSRSTLVRVPALVHSKANKLIYSLTADDFALTDDGVPQKLQLEEDTGTEPLALVVDIEATGSGARALAQCAGLTAML